MKLDEKGGLLALLTKDGIADFTNYLAEASVSVGGKKVVYTSATLQKKSAELAKATRIAGRLIKDGYIDDENKSRVDNYFDASRREGALMNAAEESKTRVSVYQKLTNKEVDHRRFSMEELIDNGEFIVRKTYVAVLSGICDNSDKLFARLERHLGDSGPTEPADELNDLLHFTTTNMLAAVALSCSAARPEDLCHILSSAIDTAAVRSNAALKGVPSLSDDDSFAFVRMQLSKVGMKTQVLFVPRRVFNLLRTYKATTRRIVIERHGYNNTTAVRSAIQDADQVHSR